MHVATFGTPSPNAMTGRAALLSKTTSQWWLQHLSNGWASGGATSLAGRSTVSRIYPVNSIKIINNIYELTSKSQYSDFMTSLLILLSN
jgi:hypothetical protein